MVWVDGSDEEWERLGLVDAGTTPAGEAQLLLVRLRPACAGRGPHLHLSVDEADAGPTNNWMDPAETKSIMTELYRGCMRGRTMYVIPFCIGPVEAENPMFGVELTDSEYVVVSMRVMARIGSPSSRR